MSPEVANRSNVACRWLPALLLLFWMAESPGQDLDRSRWFDIPASPMDSALLLFSEQAGVQILVDARLTRGRVTSPLSGYYTPIEALDSLIAGTPLRSRVVARKTVVLAGLLPANAFAASPSLPGID